ETNLSTTFCVIVETRLLPPFRLLSARIILTKPDVVRVTPSTSRSDSGELLDMIHWDILYENYMGLGVNIAGECLVIHGLIREKGIKYYLPIAKAKVPFNMESINEIEEFVHALLTLWNIVLLTVFRQDPERELNAKLLTEIAKLRKENDKIPELEKKFAEVETENAKLRQIIEENAMRKTENNELKSRVRELEQYNTELESRVAMLEQGQHDASFNNNSSNFNSVAEHHKKSLENEPANVPYSAHSLAPQIEDQEKLLEDREMDAFLIETHKKSVGNKIRRRNEEKKLLRELANQDDTLDHNSSAENSGDMKFTKSHSEDVKTMTKYHDQDDVVSKVDISETSEQDIVPGSAQSLSDLFDKAIKTGQKQILCWFYYSFEFENKVRNLTKDGKIKDKTARSKIYKKMKPFLPNITNVNLRKRARKILKLFGEGGVTSKTVTKYHDRSTSRKPEKIGETTNGNQTNAFIPLKAETLDQYSSLYREFSSENFDYYGIANEKLCPLCKLEHGDEESIEGIYKAGSYFIKCEQREIESDKVLTPEAMTSISKKPQASDFKPITFETKPDSELIIKSVLEHFTYLKFRNSLITIILYLLSRGIRHALFTMENMEIMDCMANGIEMEQNIVLPATVQAINS
ncbi:21945_t:CDS:10, partial [Gigaspora rosea]